MRGAEHSALFFVEVAVNVYNVCLQHISIKRSHIRVPLTSGDSSAMSYYRGLRNFISDVRACEYSLASLVAAPTRWSTAPSITRATRL